MAAVEIGLKLEKNTGLSETLISEIQLIPTDTL